MRHYERADLRHLNDSQRYRDYDYLADDGWPPASEPLSVREALAPAPAPAPAGAAPTPLWRKVLAGLLSPRTTLRKALAR